LFTVWQDISLAELGLDASIVDSGTAMIDFGGWQSGWNTQTDAGQISVKFLDENLLEVGTSLLPFFFSNHTWVQQAGQATVVSGTRSVRYHFEGVRTGGSNNDAFLDAAYLNVSAVPLPAALVMMLPALLITLRSRLS